MFLEDTRGNKLPAKKLARGISWAGAVPAGSAIRSMPADADTRNRSECGDDHALSIDMRAFYRDWN